MAAALSYYFVMSLFPALICLSAVLAYLMVPGVFGELIGWMGQFVPSDSMGVVKRVLSDVVSPNRGAFLSVGLLATLWTASGGVSAAMEALNMAYDVQETRPFWKLKLRAISWKKSESASKRGFGKTMNDASDYAENTMTNSTRFVCVFSTAVI